MSQKNQKLNTDNKNSEGRVMRPPIVGVFGHIDHGKSTLLDYIRKTNTTEKEAGGITQRLSAYEVIHKDKSGTQSLITFLDTPGHEAFSAMRSRGAHVADIAILVVAADEKVMPQTLEALGSIKDSGIPYIVAITKIDKPEADIERTKQSLLENEIYLEKLGGDVPWVALSSKSGKGVDELLDLILLVAEFAELSGDPHARAEGVVIETHRDQKKGIAATLIITDGILLCGQFVVAADAYAPVRIMEDFTGKAIKEAILSKPVRVIGFSKIPLVGTPFYTVNSKKEAEKMIAAELSNIPNASEITTVSTQDKEKEILPLIIKADVAGTLDAIEHELKKINQERVAIRIIQKDVGAISERDVKVALSDTRSVIIGFNVPTDSAAADLAARSNISIEQFDIIYKLTEWLEDLVQKRTPQQEVEEVTGTVKVLKTFGKTKDKQVLGGRVKNGVISLGGEVKILRRDMEIGRGKVLNLQQQKSDVKKVTDGEFGTQIQAKSEIAAGDILEAITRVTK